MKLCDCEYGKLVCTVQGDEIYDIGMIVGLTTNRQACSSEDKRGEAYAIPLVKFSHEEFPRGIHYGNLTDYKKHCRGW